MSHVEFEKWQCPLSLFLQYPCRLEDSVMSHVEYKELPMSCHLYFFPMLIGFMSHVDLRNDHVALLN